MYRGNKAMMPKISMELPRTGWVRVIRWTTLVSLGSVALSLLASEALMLAISQGLNLAGAVVAIAMPILLGTPMMFFLMLGRQKLQHVNAQLNVLASIDWLTDCLNRREFTSRASAHLGLPASDGRPPNCALLLIDADHFKAVNDRFGHEMGDTALQMIAAAITETVRPHDLVGRVGGEEFGVFLGGVDRVTAAVFAENIRAAVAAIPFGPERVAHPLSVSIGGAMSWSGATFSGVFQIADQRLYAAKHAGRNRVDFSGTPVTVQTSRAA